MINRRHNSSLPMAAAERQPKAARRAEQQTDYQNDAKNDQCIDPLAARVFEDQRPGAG
jgi:hypothetical protein